MHRLFCLLAAMISVAHAQELTVLSAGAVEPGLRAALGLYEKKTAVTFNTAPQIRERVGKGEKHDVVIVPPAVMDAFTDGVTLSSVTINRARVPKGLLDAEARLVALLRRPSRARKAA